MKNKIENFCETCKVRLNTRNYRKHFERNHTIRAKGLFILHQEAPKQIFQARALHDAKAGEVVELSLEDIGK